jgi:hypothetical protein
MPDPIPLNANTALDELRGLADKLVAGAVVVSAFSSLCGSCGGNVLNNRCEDCGMHPQVVVALLNGRGTQDELAGQAQEVFPGLPFLGFAKVRHIRALSDDPYYRIVSLAVPYPS